MYRYLANLLPKGISGKFKEILVFSGIKVHPDNFIGFIFIFGLSLSLVLAFNLKVIFQQNFIFMFIIIFLLIEVGVYTLLILNVDKKSKFIESILPDALQLMASNLRAGMTTDRALLLSARPEFGPFKDELNIAGKEITTGKEISHALKDITKRVKSDILERTIELIVSGLRSGGELASLLEQNSEDLRNEALVDKKIRSSVQMYVIFIFAAIGFGAPILYGLSSILVDVISQNLGMLEIPAQVKATIPISITGISVSSSFITKYIIISLITSSLLGSLVLGLINKGKEKEGVKYIPILLIVSITIFFVMRYVLMLVFGGLLGI